MMTTTMPLLSLTEVTPQSPQDAGDLRCPAAVAEILCLCDLDPAVVGGDWLDILLMVDGAEAPAAR